jgi:phosphatidylglycerol:prolipoprotein diacylglycerol transferase
MLKFPSIDPVIVTIGPVSIYWYSLAYVLGILFGWYYSNKLVEKFDIGIVKKNMEDFVTWAIIGIITGGRLGYVLFYDPINYLSQPLDILKTYEGGMSFHGALVGLTLTIYMFSRKYKITFLSLADIIAVVAPVGLFLGRIGNFINGELYGRASTVPWAVVFPNADDKPRHPSQLYEAIGEGLILFFVMLISVHRFNSIKFPGRTIGIFLVFYSMCRIFIETFREPDFHIGFIWSSFTMGQLLSLPLFILGSYLISRSRCQSISK